MQSEVATTRRYSRHPFDRHHAGCGEARARRGDDRRLLIKLRSVAVAEDDAPRAALHFHQLLDRVVCWEQFF